MSQKKGSAKSIDIKFIGILIAVILIINLFEYVVTLVVVGNADSYFSRVPIFRFATAIYKLGYGLHKFFITSIKLDIEKVQQMLEDSDPIVRWKAVKIVEKYGDNSHLQLIEPLLDNNNEDDFVVIAAIETIGKLGDISHKSWLLPLLSDGREEVHMAADCALRMLVARVVKEKHAGKVQQMHGSKVRCSFCTSGMVYKVLQMLEDADSTVRCEAVGIIEASGDNSHLLLIKPLLDDEDDSVRLAVVKTIGKLGDASHKSWLLPLLSDGREEVRMAAESAMQKLDSRAESN